MCFRHKSVLQQSLLLLFLHYKQGVVISVPTVSPAKSVIMIATEAFWHLWYSSHLKSLFKLTWWESDLAQCLHFPLWLSLYCNIFKLVEVCVCPLHWVVSSLRQEQCLTHLCAQRLQPLVRARTSGGELTKTSILKHLLTSSPGHLTFIAIFRQSHHKFLLTWTYLALVCKEGVKLSKERETDWEAQPWK